MCSLSNSNPSAALTKHKHKEIARYLKRIKHLPPSPFYLACENGDFAYVEKQLKMLSSDELDQIESTGETSLHIATRNNQLEIVRLLLENGCSRNIYNSSGKFPYQEARTNEMKQLYAPPNISQFFEENPKVSYGIFVPLQQIGKLARPYATNPNQITTTGDANHSNGTSVRDQELKSEQEVIQYITNRQALAMWIKICAWVYHKCGGAIRRDEEEGNDFAPELFDLDNDRDLETFLNSLAPNETQPNLIVKQSIEREETQVLTWKQRFMNVCCCKNVIAPASQPSQLTTTDSVRTAQPNRDHLKHSSLQSIHGQLACSNNPRDFIRASKDFNTVVPLIYLYTKQELRFYAELNKNLATIDNNPNRAASICDRFVREFDLREAELSKFGFIGVTYRGTTMSESDFEHYRQASEQNPKWTIVPRAFQSTTVKRSKAMEFIDLKRTKGKHVGLLVYHIPVACSTIFSVKEISRYPQEEEVLIMPGNLFTIMKVTQCVDNPDLPEVHLEHVKRDISFFKKVRTIFRAATTTASGID
ncbi:unnamed protein product [Adineta ricciae]|uniref:NAD(+)--protein-arginine ADP-ribosyltransferase n=1 Tax=Adineta ricciae TaxID=249248 RepID=A0A815R2V9_ADIRI|nr:unnamed protein product [Adineta ricciae]CAF1471088.1 unnamed protein product [Adineta ricciae]